MAMMSKSKTGMGTGENAQYMKKGGTKKKMNKVPMKAVPSKKMGMGGGKYKIGGKKGM